MTDIYKVKHEEMEEILDFYNLVIDYGHIYYDAPELLDAPFKKILEGIAEVEKMIDDGYGR